MAKTHASLLPYRNIYEATNFERRRLFEFLEQKLHPRETLYPGCGVHITPAFFFPHVIFVDQSEEAIQFFAKHEEIIKEIQRNKIYQRSSYIQFIAQDYTKKLPVRENQFDLLLSLFADKIAKNCAAYLKPGGFLLTNNHHGDASDAAQNKEFTFLGDIELRRGKYNFKEKDGFASKDEKRSQRYLRDTSSGVEYIKEEIYYLFQRSSQKTKTK